MYHYYCYYYELQKGEEDKKKHDTRFLVGVLNVVQAQICFAQAKEKEEVEAKKKGNCTLNLPWYMDTWFLAIISISACLRCDRKSVGFVPVGRCVKTATAAAAAACDNVDGKSILLPKPKWLVAKSPKLPVPQPVDCSLLRRCKFWKNSAENVFAWAFSNSSWIGMVDCDVFVRIDDAVDTHDGDDVDDEPPANVWLLYGVNSVFKLSNSTLIDTVPSLADSFSQMLAGDQMIALEFDRCDFVDKFNGSSSSISEECEQFSNVKRCVNVIVPVIFFLAKFDELNYL